MICRILSVFGICLIVIADAMNWSIVNTAIPSIQRDLNASLTMMQWLMNSFGLALVPFLVSFSRLADLYGRKLFFVTAAFIFTLASFFAGLSSSLISLICWRSVQGLTTAVILPMSQVLLIKQFEEKDKGLAIGIWMLTIGIGCGLGPFVGGFLIELLSWRWIFYINVPFCLVGFLLTLFLTKESKDPEHTPSLDILGNILLVAFLAALILGIVQGPDWGWRSGITISLFFLSLVCCVAFYYVEKKSESPIIDFSLYKTNRFVVSSFAVFYIIFFVWGVFFLLPLYLQNALDFSPIKAGVALLLLSLPFSLVSPYIGHIQKRFAPKYFLVLGLFLIFIGALIAAFLPLHKNWSIITISFVCFGLGWAIAFGPSITAALDSFPEEKIGLAAGSINTCQEFGGSIGLAILGSIFRSGDKSYIMQKLNLIDADFVKENLPLINSKMSDPKAMLETIKGLYPEKFQEVMNIFYEGFLKGFHDAMFVLAALGLLTCLLVLCLLKKKVSLKHS